MEKNFVVYQIRVDSIVVYIGRTTVDRITAREKEHRYGYRKHQRKQLYDWLHIINYLEEDIILEPIYLAKTKLESKHYECFTILFFRFNYPDQLKQRVPIIKDY